MSHTRFAYAMKARQEAGAKARVGPDGSLLSRTPTTPVRSSATSTHEPPFEPERDDLRHCA